MRKTFFVVIVCLLICAGAYRWGGAERVIAKEAALEQMYYSVSKLFLPHVYLMDGTKGEVIYRDVEQVMLPTLANYRMSLWHQNVGQENIQQEVIEQEFEREQSTEPKIDEGLEQAESVAENEDVSEVATETAAGVVRQKQVTINRTKLQDFDYLRQNFYQVDNTTTVDSQLLNVNKLLGIDLTLEKNVEGPQVLIYHTHSQEAYADSTAGDAYTSVVAVGDYLGRLLTENYGIEVLHHMGEYDVMDRDSAYSTALPYLEQVLKDYPSIEVVIDLHRDGVPAATRLVTEINGKPTAQIMFFNGLSRTTSQGELEYLSNPYIEENLAFSFQMQLAAAEYYPGLTRRIYLKGYRYNMHLAPKSLLVEVGAQTNTFQEAKNAMEPLADLLAKVLKGM